MSLPNRSNTDRRGCQHTDTRVVEYKDAKVLVCRGCGATYNSTVEEWVSL